MSIHPLPINPKAGVSNGWGAKLLTLLKMLSNKLGSIVLAVVCLNLLAAPASAQIYSWRDANGHLVLGNTPRSTAEAAGVIVRSYPVPKSDIIRTTSRAASDRVLMYDGLITDH